MQGVRKEVFIGVLKELRKAQHCVDRGERIGDIGGREP